VGTRVVHRVIVSPDIGQHDRYVFDRDLFMPPGFSSPADATLM
jgi:hypothetical protein